MKLIFTIFCSLFLFQFIWGQVPSFIPEPQEITWLEGTCTLTANTVVNGPNSLINEKTYLQELLPISTDGNIQEGRKETVIVLDIDRKIQNAEGYHLTVQDNKITILGATPQGVFMGIQTLLQMMPAEIYYKDKPAQISIPNVEVFDKPQFPWRGLLLDCSRHFMEKEFVLRYIDLLAYHKMNTLHWHITEDQGWRIEIKKYPKLTEVGAWRADVNDEVKDGLPGDLYGGFYTQEDIKEIVDYAAKRHINVVPEIEMPGHCQASLAAYPEYSCTGGPFEVETEWGVFKEIYCAGNPNTYTFLTDILDEVLELFPSKYIHIGGDEVPKYRWEHCDKCKAHKQKNGLENEEALQSHFLGTINDYLKSKDRIMVGWDEIAEGGLPNDAIVQSWRGMEGAIHAVEQGHASIVSPTSHAYFDYDLKSIDLEQVYSFDPIPEDISEEQKTLILGGECNMWSERAPQETVDSKIFPRLLAMTEVLWSYPEQRNYQDFYKKTQSHYERLKAMGVDYGFETVPVNFSSQYQAKQNGMKAHTSVSLHSGTPDLDLKYSLNDGEWKDYRQAFGLNQSADIKVNAFKDGETYGDTFEVSFEQHKGIGSKYELTKVYSDYYTGGDYQALVNGWKGTTDFRDGQWQGYWGEDLVATFDFSAEPKTISTVGVGFLQYNNSWIFMPRVLIVEMSNDGKNYIEIGRTSPKTSPKQRGKVLEKLETTFEEKTVFFLRVKAKNYGKCPDWHEAAGSDGWLFVDEIEMK